MDSVTQILLGASVGHVTLGRRVGRKAALWGGVWGLLPDLDVLLPFSSDVARFTWHRSFSHSLFVLAALTPLCVWGMRRIHGKESAGRGPWTLLVSLAFVTHVLLDCLTVYGTQIFWPVDPTPVAWASLFIIDPLYSLPLLVGLLVVLLVRRKPRTAWRVNAFLLALSTMYAAWAFAAARVVDRVATESLVRQGLPAERVLTVAGPLTTLLWRVVSMDETGLHEAWFSLLDTDRELEFTHHPSDPALLEGLQDHPPVQRLQWFTRGYYSVSLEEGAVVITDLRMGSSDGYAFRFQVGEAGNPHSRPIEDQQLPAGTSWSQLGLVWDRLLGR